MTKPNNKISAREFCDVLFANKNVTPAEILMILRKEYPHLEPTRQGVNNYLSSLKASSLTDISHDKTTGRYTLRSISDAYFRYSAYRQGEKKPKQGKNPQAKPRSVMDDHEIAICRLVSMFDRCISSVRSCSVVAN